MPKNWGWRLLLAAGAIPLAACGALFTEAPSSDDVLDAPLEGLSPVDLAAFARGDAEFARRFAASSGLGPIFNNVSCASCHSGDGRGTLGTSLTRIGSQADGFLRALGGPQIQDKAIAGATAERAPAGVALSVRLPPPVFGMGLIEAIPDAAILALADPDDTNRDGISGRPNWVTAADYVPPATPGGGAGAVIGRFGRKAQVSNLVEQVVEAYHQDIGITSAFRPHENVNPAAGTVTAASDAVPDPEIPEATVHAVVHYVRALAAPPAGEETPARATGRDAFAAVGCIACHVPELRTGRGTAALAVLSDRVVPLYSDLLLHDMGDALADGRPDGSATGREWRTAPLWGLRLMRRFLDGQALLMHDGRARSVDEAIRLHGGEATRARDAYLALPADRRGALVDFVESR